MFKRKFIANEFMVRCQVSLRRIEAEQQKFLQHKRTYKKQILTLLDNNDRDKALEKTAILVKEDYKSEALVELVDIVDLLLKNSEVIASQKICPLELKSACGAILYSSPYFPDHTEMREMRDMLIDKFGKTFPEECVNSKVVSAKLLARLNNKPIDSDVVEYYLDNIIQERNYNELDDVPVVRAIPTTNPHDNLPLDINKCELSHLPNGYAKEKYTFGVLTRDVLNNIRKGGDTVEVFIGGPNNAKIIGEVKDLHDGSYDVTFIPPFEGGYLIAVYINNQQMPNYGQLMIEPSKMNQLDLSKTIIEGDGIMGGYVNEKQIFTIFTRDMNGEPYMNGGEPFAAYIAGPNDLKIMGDIHDLGNGEYDVSYIPPLVGNYAIAVYHNTTPIQNVFNFTIMERMTQFPSMNQMNSSMMNSMNNQMNQSIQNNQNNLEQKSFITIQGKPDEHFIIDVGSCYIKAGFESSRNPTIITPTVIGKNIHKSSLFNSEGIHVGDEAIDKRGILSLEYPLQKQPIDYESLKLIIKHSMEMANGHPIVVVFNALLPLQLKIHLCEIMFEQNATAIRFVDQTEAVATYYQKPNCIVVDIGGNMTTVIPYIGCKTYENMAQKLPLGGIKITEILLNLLSKEGITLGSTSSEKEICRQLKETLGEINKQPNSRNQLDKISYDLPDGHTLLIGTSRSDCFEPLFNPQLVAMTCGGISQMIAYIIQSSNGQLKDVILVGGTTTVKGMKERIENELKMFFGMDITILSSSDNKYIPWMGAKVVDQQNIGKVITKEMWNKDGALCLDE